MPPGRLSDPTSHSTEGDLCARYSKEKTQKLKSFVTKKISAAGLQDRARLRNDRLRRIRALLRAREVVLPHHCGRSQPVVGPAAYAPKPTLMTTLAKREAGWKPDDRLPGAWRRPCADIDYRAAANVKTAHLPERLAEVYFYKIVRLP